MGRSSSPGNDPTGNPCTKLPPEGPYSYRSFRWITNKCLFYTFRFLFSRFIILAKNLSRLWRCVKVSHRFFTLYPRNDILKNLN